MALLEHATSRFLLTCLIPWSIAFWCTRKYVWTSPAWLDRSIRIQTALLCVIAVAQVFGAMGLFNTVTICLTPLFYVFVTFLYAQRPDGQEIGEPPENESTKCGIVVFGIATLAVTLTFGKLFVPSLVGAPKVVSDGPIYHLYFAARWWVESTISWIPIPFGENAAPYFPANGDLWFMTLTGWTGDISLAKIGQVPFWFLGGYWLYLLCRRLTNSGPASLIAASCWMTITPLALFTFEANVDTIFAAWFIASVLFYVEFDLRRNQTHADSRSMLLLIHCLLAAGLAWGTKAPGIVFVPPWILFITVRELQQDVQTAWSMRLLKFLKYWLIAILPVVSWWIRNAIATGNPLYPLPVSLFGITVFDGWYGPEVMKLSPYYIPVQEWRAFVDQLAAVADARLLPVYFIATVFAIVRYFRNGTGENRWIISLAGLGIMTIAIYWLVVPYRTQQRFFLHGMAMFAPAIALFARSSKMMTCAVTALVLVHVISPQGWPISGPGREPAWDLSMLIPNGIPAIVSAPELLAKTITGDLKYIGMIALWAAICAIYWPGSQKRRLGGVLAAICALAMMTFSEHKSFERVGRGLRYPIFPDYERAWNAFDAVTRKEPKSVAYTGTNLAVYLMGHDLRNRVQYINVDRHTGWMPHDYHLAQPPEKRRWPDPRPTWERLSPDYSAWLANLEAKHIDLIVTARANPNEGNLNPFDSKGFPIERTWMMEHPDRFEPVYGVRENDPEMQIFALIPSKTAPPRPMP